MAPLTVQDPDLHFKVTVPVSVEDAFRMWTDSAEAREFLALDVRIDPRVGGRYETIFDPENDPAGTLAGTYGSKVLQLKPPLRLVFEWHSLTPRAAAAEVDGLRALALVPLLSWIFAYFLALARDVFTRKRPMQSRRMGA